MSNPARPQPGDEVLVIPPDGLTPKAAAFWREVVREWPSVGEAPDARELLHRACQTVDALDAAQAVLDAEGTVYHDRFGAPRAHPCVAQVRDHRIALVRLLRELRLEPEDTARPPRGFGA